MADFAPPSGPPPPRVPAGWKAIWNAEYKEWFYVNIYTKQSQWEMPTMPAMEAHGDVPPSGGPPGYVAGANAPVGAGMDTKRFPGESDEAMARRLQAEETAARDRGHGDNYYGQGNPSQYGQNTGPSYMQSGYPGGPPAGAYNQSSGLGGASGGGLLGKLKSKLMSGPAGGSQGLGGGYPQQQHGGGYPQQGYGGYPQQGYGGYPQQGYGGYGQQGMYGMPAKKKAGMGVGGAAALGVGGGLLGGAMLANAMGDHEHGGYGEGYGGGSSGSDGGGFGGGGDDFGGGDFGGD